MALTTLDALKTLLGVADASQDALLTPLLAAADRAVKSYCGRDLEQATYTEYLSGNGQRDLVLRQRPVTAVSAVYEDPSGYWGQRNGTPAPFGAATQLVAGQDYALVLDQGTGTAAAGLLRRIGGMSLLWPVVGVYPVSTLSGGRAGPTWRIGSGNLKVTYTAGYASGQIPADLAQAVLQLAVWLRNSRKRGGQPIQSEQLGDYNYALVSLTAGQAAGQAPELGSTRQLLSPYREVRLGGLG